jgi:hypothetical protein
MQAKEADIQEQGPSNKGRILLREGLCCCTRLELEEGIPCTDQAILSLPLKEFVV